MDLLMVRNIPRIISRLDIKGPNLVKGVNLEGLRVLGKPGAFAQYYYQTGVDELLYMDAVASLYERNGIFSLVSESAREIFIPITVGGGIRTIEDIKAALNAGADKVAINTQAIKNPKFISDAVAKFGSSTIVGALEVQKKLNGKYECYIEGGREKTGKSPQDWAVELSRLGVGELLITSIDNEGTGNGFDLDLIRNINNLVGVPVIASGGAGPIENIMNALKIDGLGGVAIASMFHYGAADILSAQNNQDFSDEGNISYLKDGSYDYHSSVMSVKELKNKIFECGLQVRPYKEYDL